MTLLNETQMLARLVDPDPERRLIITPLIRPEEQFGPTSLDVRLGTDFQVMRRTNLACLNLAGDPAQLAEDVRKSSHWVKVKPGEPFVLHPGEFALASTLEFVRIPLDLAARLEGRSTWGRLGLQVHATAGFVDPGFSGALTFELSNVSTMPLTLYPGVRIAQLCFYQSTRTQLPYHRKRYSKYSGKTSTATSAFFQDPEYARIRASHAPAQSLTLR